MDATCWVCETKKARCRIFSTTGTLLYMLAQDDLCRSSPSPDRIIVVIIIANELSNLEIVYMHGIYPVFLPPKTASSNSLK